MNNYTMTDYSVLGAIGAMLLIVGVLIVVINHICVMRQIRMEHLYTIKENSMCNVDAVAMEEYKIELQRRKDMDVNNNLIQQTRKMYKEMVNDLPKQVGKMMKEFGEL